MLKRLQKFKGVLPSFGPSLAVPRRCFSDYEEVEEASEGLNESAEYEAPVKKDLKYLFMKRTFAFVVDKPVLTLIPYTLHIGPKKMKFLKSFIMPDYNMYATAILPRDIEQPFSEQMEELARNSLTEEIGSSAEHPRSHLLREFDKDHSKLFYDIGSYCLIDILDEESISLRCLHKSRASNITGIHLKDEEAPQTSPRFHDIFRDESNVNLENLIESELAADGEEAEQHKNKADKTEPATAKLKENATQSSGKTGLPMSLSKRLKINVPDDIIHVTENEAIPTYDSKKLSIELRTKIDYLANYANKVLFQSASDKIIYVNYNDLDNLFDAITHLLNEIRFFKYEEIVSLFVCTDANRVVDKTLLLMRRYIIFLAKMHDIGRMAEQNIYLKKNREYYQEVYNIIKKLAEGDKDNPVAKLEKEFNSKTAPAHVREIFTEVARRLSSLDKHHPEYYVQKNYLEWLVAMPYGIQSLDTFDLEIAKKELDESHFGLADVKKRILEFIGVGKLNGSLKGKILCLEGPPGVGKTSFAFSVAKALNRKVYRLSLGGENDVAVLKGHRKTYIGARPGKIVAALKDCGTENCVIIIDEIDKLHSASVHGDPQAALLEILDPEQNNAFTDNYLDFPIDLSKVLFICTANKADRISSPLLDRMDIIHINSYTNEEKKHIFERFLIPKGLEESGLKDRVGQFEIKKEVIDSLLIGYAREAGIRSLQKYTNKLLEKLAYMILQKEEGHVASLNLTPNNVEFDDKIVVEPGNLSTFIGLREGVALRGPCAGRC